MSYCNNVEFPAKFSINDAIRKSSNNRKKMDFVVPRENMKVGLYPLQNLLDFLFESRGGTRAALLVPSNRFNVFRRCFRVK